MAPGSSGRISLTLVSSSYSRSLLLPLFSHKYWTIKQAFLLALSISHSFFLSSSLAYRFLLLLSFFFFSFLSPSLLSLHIYLQYSPNSLFFIHFLFSTYDKYTGLSSYIYIYFCSLHIPNLSLYLLCSFILAFRVYVWPRGHRILTLKSYFYVLEEILATNISRKY